MEADSRVWGDDASPEEEERYREIIRQRVESSPFYQHMGMEVTGLGRGWATFRMPAGRHLWNAGGIVHGGAVTSIADAATGVAIATLLDKHKERPVTIELKLNFCSPVVEGTIEARGQVVQKGSRIAVCEVEVTAHDRLVAKGISTYMVIEAVD